MTGERITSQGGVLVIGGEKKLAEGGYPLQLQKNHRITVLYNRTPSIIVPHAPVQSVVLRAPLHLYAAGW